ncbi:MAG: hypothetical protein ACE5HT_14595, partial [Gemmatimonadales bacterium]
TAACKRSRRSVMLPRPTHHHRRAKTDEDGQRRTIPDETDSFPFSGPVYIVRATHASPLRTRQLA